MLNNNAANKMQNSKKITMSQIMRDQIALVKQADCATTTAQQQYVVEWMCNMLAFKKQLARVYVKENWSKVSM